MKSFSICMSINVIIHLHFWKTLGGSHKIPPCLFCLQSFKEVAPLSSHFHCFWWEIWHLFLFLYVPYPFPLVPLEILFFFNGFEQFNYDVTRCGFFMFLVLIHFVRLAHWIGGFIISTTTGIFWHCFFKDCFFSLCIFRDISHACIRSFNVALPLNDTMFIKNIFFWQWVSFWILSIVHGFVFLNLFFFFSCSV